MSHFEGNTLQPYLDPHLGTPSTNDASVISSDTHLAGNSSSIGSHSAPTRRKRANSSGSGPLRPRSVCQECGITFQRHEHLMRHMASHETDLPKFACTKCSKRFTRKDVLDRHIRVHGEQELRKSKLDSLTERKRSALLRVSKGEKQPESHRRLNRSDS